MNFLIRNKYNLLILALVLIFLGVSSNLILNISRAASKPVADNKALYNMLISDLSNNIEEVDDDSIITSKKPNNYVWYSGKLWRAVSVNNNDNTTKLVTDDAVVTLSSADNIDYFLNDTSNNGFLGSLKSYKDYIKQDSIWTKYNDGRILGDIRKSKSYETITNPVGLLTTYDYQLSYNGTTESIGDGYLNNNTNWATYTYDNDSNMIVNKEGNVETSSKELTHLIRPAINILSSVEIKGGDGSESNPYYLEDYVEDNALLNTRSIGEYVHFNDELYRIVTIDEEKTKLVSMKTLNNKKFSSKESKFDLNDKKNIAYYLNHDWYEKLSDNSKELLVEGKFYNSKCTYEDNYKDIIKGEYVNAKIGLLRYEEMFTTNEKNDYFLITPYDKEYNRVIYSDSLSGAIRSNTKLAFRIALYIRSDAYIKDGIGTKDSPFIITIK